MKTTLTLSGVSFDVPPEQYDPLAWSRRASVLVGASLSVVVQDGGVTVKDLRMRFSSGQSQLMSTDTVTKLLGLWALRGASHVLTDYLGNSFNVFFLSFHPTVAFAGQWRYTMELVVLSVVKVLGKDWPFTVDLGGGGGGSDAADTYQFSGFGGGAVQDYDVGTSETLLFINVVAKKNGATATGYSGQATLTLSSSSQGQYKVVKVYRTDHVTLFSTNTTPPFVAGVCETIYVVLQKLGGVADAIVHLVATDGAVVGTSNPFHFRDFGTL